MTIATNKQKIVPAQYTVPRETAPDMGESAKFFPHGRILRALGDRLQQDGLVEFELQIRNGIYCVQGSTTPVLAPRPSLLRKILSLGRPEPSKRSVIRRELQYTIADLLSYDSEARAQRRQSGELTDPHVPSQILRGVASYLDKRKGSRLIGVVIKDRWVTIEYLSADGQVQKERQDFEYFYDYWVKMFTRRSNRPELPAPSDPTLFVTWEARLRRHKLSEIPL